MRARCIAMATAAAVLGGLAAAETAIPSGPPPSWQSLIPCARSADPVDGFNCYQAAVRAAGYTPNPEIVAAERRRRFGLVLPSFGQKGAGDRQAERALAPAGAHNPGDREADDRITYVLDQVATLRPLDRLLLVTREGAVWMQTDSETVAPLPKAGQSMTVVKGAISGFFCQFDKRTKVRCVRTH